jgi:redox-sensitive bicupin YhaK (pirin superfamily)
MNRLELRASEPGVRFLLVLGKPLREPIARHGPFVMKTEAITCSMQRFEGPPI